MENRQAKIDKLKSQVDSIRIGGKGSARRKKKIVHKNTGTDERKVTTTLKKLGVNAIPGIEEVNMFREGGEVIHFTNPKVQASLQANTFAITGQAETKSLTELLPTVWNQMGPESFASLKKMAAGLSSASKPEEGDDSNNAEAAAAVAAAAKDDDDVPELTGNFDEASKTE
uniref:Transcription factor BTF3 n=2 Tax=Macrostomum lignano TaxID=282301 RepID=A0A1I8GUZ1_9PLAT